MQFAPEKGGHVVGFDGVDGGARQCAVDVLEIRWSAENDIRGLLGLHDAPVIVQPKVADHRAVASRETIQQLMDCPDLQAIRQSLGLFPLGDVHEGVVDLSERVPVLSGLGGEPVVAVEIDLQTKRAPRGYPHITEPQLLVDKVEVVVEAFGLVGLQVGLAGLFVVPGLVGRAALHGRKNGHQARSIAALLQNLPDQLVFPGFVVAHEFDLEAVFSCQPLGIFAEIITEWFGKPGVVEDPDPVCLEVGDHSRGVAHHRQRTLDEDAVVTTQNALDLFGVALRKQAHDAISGSFAQ